jgi:prepilin-type N-terminal cleavage/methylation domain-containing protein
MRTALTAVRRAARAGFTLIELLAVIVIIGILMTFLIPRITEAIDEANVTACKANMTEINKAMLLYKNSMERVPNQSGAKFFTELITKGILENSKSAAKRMTCPGVDTGALPGLQGKTEIEWYKNLEEIDGTCTSYAGRDTQRHPLRKFPGSGNEVLVADDNDPEMNHNHTTVALMADGSVNTYEIAKLKESGLLGPDENHLIVGPDSPVEALRVLSLD